MNDLLKIAVRKRRVSSINNHRVFSILLSTNDFICQTKGFKELASERRGAVAVLLPAALSFIATGFSFAVVAGMAILSN